MMGSTGMEHETHLQYLKLQMGFFFSGFIMPLLH